MMLLRLNRSQRAVTTCNAKRKKGTETQQVGIMINCRKINIFFNDQQRHSTLFQKFTCDFGGVKSSCTVAALGTFHYAIIRHGACHIEAQPGQMDKHGQSALLQLTCTVCSPGLKLLHITSQWQLCQAPRGQIDRSAEITRPECAVSFKACRSTAWFTAIW